MRPFVISTDRDGPSLYRRAPFAPPAPIVPLWALVRDQTADALMLSHMPLKRGLLSVAPYTLRGYGRSL